MEEKVKNYFDRCPDTVTEVWASGGKLWTSAGAAESGGDGTVKKYTRAMFAAKKGKKGEQADPDKEPKE